MIPPSLIQAYLENAIWHGLMPANKPGKLWLSFKTLDYEKTYNQN